MRFLITTFLALTITSGVNAQHFEKFSKQEPEHWDFDNIKVEKVESSADVSSFLIWIRESVRLHEHREHDEHVYVLKGKGTMTLGDRQFEVKKGDLIYIPRNTPHSVVVKSKILKVLSIQAPEFKGEDRYFLDE